MSLAYLTGELRYAARLPFFSRKISRTNQLGIDQLLPRGSRRNMTRR